MHREIHTADPGKRGRLAMFFGLLALLLIVRLLMGFAAGLPYAWLAQGLMLLLPLALFMWMYRRKLCAYRYTLFHREPEPGELDQFGDQARLPYPLGTLIFERIVGRREKAVELISPGEMVRLLPPGAAPQGAKGGPVYAAAGRKAAHTLVYRRKGREQALCFCPSAELSELLREIIRAVNDCGGGE